MVSVTSRAQLEGEKAILAYTSELQSKVGWLLVERMGKEGGARESKEAQKEVRGWEQVCLCR